MTQQVGKGNFIKGWRAANGKPFESIDPATGFAVWQGNAASMTDVEQAIRSAKEAFPSWSQLSFEQRCSHLNRFRDALMAHKNELALAISKEIGKPLWDSTSEVDAMINKIPLSIEAYQLRCAEFAKGTAITRHKPHGVVAVLGPFNFPGHLPNGHIVPALLAGNTVIFKPSELAPLVAEVTLQCWEKAELPPGVISMVQGAHEVGAAVAEHPSVRALFFTGSYRTGRFLSELFGKHPDKILALEMGGNNPLVIGDIADNQAAAYLTVQSAYLTSGQRCSCARRLIVPIGVKGDQFLAALQTVVKSVRVGRYSDIPEPFMGPVISEKAALQLLDAQSSLVDQGGKILNEMRLLEPATGLVTPALIDVTQVSPRRDEEYFGPFLQVIRVPNFEAALVEANNTRYGLSAGLFSQSKEQYELFYQTVKAGVINWNNPLTGASSAAPFGGIGQSGNHRPSAYYAADYCSYPVASIETPLITLPTSPLPGLIP